jgi:hypothetical protein
MKKKKKRKKNFDRFRFLLLFCCRWFAGSNFPQLHDEHFVYVYRRYINPGKDLKQTNKKKRNDDDDGGLANGRIIGLPRTTPWGRLAVLTARCCVTYQTLQLCSFFAAQPYRYNSANKRRMSDCPNAHTAMI